MVDTALHIIHFMLLTTFVVIVGLIPSLIMLLIYIGVKDWWFSNQKRWHK